MKVAFLTSGGIAPCLSSSIGRLIYNYSKLSEEVEFIGYLNGYKGLLTNKKMKIPSDIGDKINYLYDFGGTFLGNSRVKLTNINDCIEKGYINKNDNPLSVAANQLLYDKVDILHTIGGDDTNTTAFDLVNYLKDKDYKLTVDRCHSTVGIAILNTSITIVFGFSILILSNFIPTIYFGIFTGIAMLLALISVLTLLPKLILVFKPFGNE